MVINLNRLTVNDNYMSISTGHYTSVHFQVVSLVRLRDITLFILGILEIFFEKIKSSSHKYKFVGN